ncbi:MAG: hypothetical protein ACUVSE_11900 [Armatimonadota bacterium]
MIRYGTAVGWCALSVIFLLATSAYGNELPFTMLDKVQEQQAIASAKRAVELWLKKEYESLFDYLSTAENFFSEMPEPKRKLSFQKWCKVWREKNAYNSQLRADEKIERIRRAAVNTTFITAYVMQFMREEYFKALIDAKWPPEKKLAFIEFFIRGKRYIQPLLLEGNRWKILSIPLSINESMIRELSGKPITNR